MSSYPIETIRHTLAHVMAAAVQKLYPDVKFGIGPAVDDGFYYDFDSSHSFTEEDFKAIEKEMRSIINNGLPVEQSRIPVDRAIADMQAAGQTYKVELLEEIKRGERPETSGVDTTSNDDTISFYTIGDFTDLCKGPHVATTKDLPADGFKLARVAGAYWRGKETHPQLQRIYAFAFPSKEELKAHIALLEEAKKRDHKVLGPQLDLFTFSDLVGSGLPLWTPRGTLVRNLLDEYVWTLRSQHGYERVEIPHITKKDLYITSGHWAKFKDELFKITTREGHEFAMKPMNCPHHTQIYARKQWSYRELPQRYANTTMCYRDEQSGELSGLSRVRSFTQDDAHVFCRMDQVKDEFLKIWDIIHEFYPTFGFQLRVRLSLHDPAHPEKYLGDTEKWPVAEHILRDIVTAKNVDWFEGIGEAAFYGPKLDFMAKDAIGREWQVATIQLDMNMPENFDLTCINEEGAKERIVMIHAAIMGSIERFLSILIEHTAGALPLWLSPVQVAVLPISDKFNDRAHEVQQQLVTAGIRAELHDENESVGKKIRSVELMKVPYCAVIGEKEVDTQTVAVRQRGKGDTGAVPLDTFIADLKQKMATRSAE